MTATVQYVNGAAKRDTPTGALLAPDLSTNDMPARAETVKLPTWLIGTLIGMAVTFLGQFGATLYQVGQWHANQTNMSAQIQQLQQEIARQREEISALRVQIAQGK